MSLAGLAKELRTHEEMAPGFAQFWCVYDVELVAIGDTDRLSDKEWEYAWFDIEGTEELIEHGDDWYEALGIIAEGEDIVTVDSKTYERLKLLHVPKLVSVFFTCSSSKRFIKDSDHELRKPYIESITLDRRNAEMHEVRSLIANTF